MNRAEVQKAIEQIIRLFESGQLPEAVARSYLTRLPGDEKPSDKWSLGNRLIMLLHGTTDARGAKQWNRAGRKVKKGAKPFYILAPVFRIETIQRAVTETDPETGEETVKWIEEKRQVLIGFKGVPVFRREDTEPLPGHKEEEISYAPPQLPPLYDVAEKLGVKVTWSPGSGFADGSYNPSSKEIRLHTHDVGVFFHELAHAAHHKIAGNLKRGQDPFQEIVAETVAVVLCKLYGYEGWEAHSYEYIRAYAGEKNPARAIMSFLSTVEQVLDFILGLAEEKKDGEAKEAA